MNVERLRQALRALEGRRVAVVGDLMLDEYVWGDVSRISPDAPVQVVDIRARSMIAGGAANVAANIAAAGGRPVLVGVLGDDAAGPRAGRARPRGGDRGRGADRREGAPDHREDPRRGAGAAYRAPRPRGQDAALPAGPRSPGGRPGGTPPGMRRGAGLGLRQGGRGWLAGRRHLRAPRAGRPEGPDRRRSQGRRFLALRRLLGHHPEPARGRGRGADGDRGSRGHRGGRAADPRSVRRPVGPHHARGKGDRPVGDGRGARPGQRAGARSLRRDRGGGHGARLLRARPRGLAGSLGSGGAREPCRGGRRRQGGDDRRRAGRDLRLGDGGGRRGREDRRAARSGGAGRARTVAREEDRFHERLLRPSPRRARAPAREGARDGRFPGGRREHGRLGPPAEGRGASRWSGRRTARRSSRRWTRWTSWCCSTRRRRSS